MPKFRKDLTALTNVDLLNFVNELKTKNLGGIYMRDTLPNEPKVEDC